jgi:hypothetical protein
VTGGSPFSAVKHHVPNHVVVSDVQRLFIGACFTMEYSVESAALFNPSMVPAVDQSNVPPGSIRFLMSLRATACTENERASHVSRHLDDSRLNIDRRRPDARRALEWYGSCRRSDAIP